MLRDSFIRFLRYEKRFSPHTVNAYSSDLEQFFLYLKNFYKTDNIRQVNHSMIRSWIVSLMENKISARTVSRKISTLKSFYKFLQREKAVEQNPMHKIQSPKIPGRLPVFVEEKNMKNLLDEVSVDNTFTSRRNLLILEMLYVTGMRRAELIHLKDADIDFSKKNIKVFGKRNKERIIPIASPLKKLLKEYICLRNKEIGDREEFLFVTGKGKKMYAGLVYKIVRTFLEKATTLSKKSPHVLRHTFATHLLNNGASINAIKELLGHANLASTQIYSHNTIEKLKSVYLKAHPKA